MCEEVMSTEFEVCYCGGPVKKIDGTEEDIIKSRSYQHRAWLWKTRGNK